MRYHFRLYLQTLSFHSATFSKNFILCIFWACCISPDRDIIFLPFSFLFLFHSICFDDPSIQDTQKETQKFSINWCRTLSTSFLGSNGFSGKSKKFLCILLLHIHIEWIRTKKKKKLCCSLSGLLPLFDPQDQADPFFFPTHPFVRSLSSPVANSFSFSRHGFSQRLQGNRYKIFYSESLLTFLDVLSVDIGEFFFLDAHSFPDRSFLSFSLIFSRKSNQRRRERGRRKTLPVCTFDCDPTWRS